jgi:hypothetical protein
MFYFGFQFEQPIYNPWQHRRCSIDDDVPHTIVVTTASSTRNTPNPSFLGSVRVTDFDDEEGEEDLGIQDWYELESPQVEVVSSFVTSSQSDL